MYENEYIEIIDDETGDTYFYEAEVREDGIMLHASPPPLDLDLSDF